MKMSENKLSASQRIENLERSVMSTYQTLDMMVRDLTVLKDAVKLLGNKVDSVVKGVNAGGPLTDEVISRFMIENNVVELKEKVSQLITQGVLVAQDSITESSFLVGREVSEDGIVLNPRLQFALSALAKELQAKLLGHKVGDLVELQEGKLKFEVSEVYSIQAPQEPTEEAPVETAPAPTEGVAEVAPEVTA